MFLKACHKNCVAFKNDILVAVEGLWRVLIFLILSSHGKKNEVD